MLNIRKFLLGLRIIPVSSSSIDSKGELEVLNSSSKLNYHNGTTASPVVTEAHSATLTNKSIDADTNTITNIENADIKAGAAIDATKIANGSVSNTEFQYLDGVTSAIQTQIDGKLSNTLTSAHIYVGNGSNVATDVAVTGDIAISNTGVTTIQAGAVDLTTDVSGILPVPNGGTGANTLTNHGVLLGQGTSAIVATAVGATGTVLHGNTGADPTFSAVSLTADVSGILPLANGGTNKNMTASAGSVAYSDSDSLELSAVGSSGQVLQSGGTGAPTWSTPTYPSASGSSGQIIRSDGTNNLYTTATYPNTTTANRILYSSANNTISEITSANTSSLVTNSSGVPSFTSGTTANRVLRTDGSSITFSQVVLTTDVSGVLPEANVGLKRTINAQTGTTYTFVLSDGSAAGGNTLVTLSNASAITATVPANGSVAYPVGTQIDVVQQGAGQVTFAPDTGVTINSKGGNLKISAQYVGVTLIKTATNTWTLLGDLTA